MCGIAGFFTKNDLPADEGMLSRMTNALILRGPDGAGFFTQECFALGHRRLAVMDPAGGAQPLFNEDRSVVMVHNGELYNFPELRKALECKGHVFRTNSDSECIVHLYEEYGPAFPEKLMGMFAIALIDLKKRKLYLATDRAGKKPVFYFDTPSHFCFASSVKGLAASGIMPDELNLQGIWDYFSLLYIPAPDTLYRQVRKLPPASIMTFSPDAEYPDVRIYWKPDFSQKTALPYQESTQKLRELVTDAVRRRLISDVPLGVFLSGGLDSAIIAAVAAKIPSSEPLQCFTIGFGSKRYDETRIACAHAKFLKSIAVRAVEHHVRQVVPGDFPVLEQLCAEYGQPLADASILPTYMLSRFAREKVTVCLSGDGADELFAGYERYLAMNLLAKLDRIPDSLRHFLAGITGRLFSAQKGERTFGTRINRLLNASLQDPVNRYFSIINKFPEYLKSGIAGDAFLDMRPEGTIRLLKEWKRSSVSANPGEKCMEIDFKSYLCNDILVKADTASMTASLEVRSPFLDQRIAEFASALPMEYKLHGKMRKRILCDAFRDILPPGAVSMRKRGFGVPVSEWLRGPWKEELTGHLLDGLCVSKLSLFRKEKVETLIHEHLFRRKDHAYPLYAMLVLELTLESVTEL